MLPDSCRRPALPVFGAAGLAVPVAWATTAVVVPPVLPTSYASSAAGARAAMRPTSSAATRSLIGVLRSDKSVLLLELGFTFPRRYGRFANCDTTTNALTGRLDL